MKNGGFDGYQYCLYIVIIYIYNHPKSIFYVSKDDYMYTYIYI